MSDYDIYVFVLCFIVYVMLVTVGIFVISVITKLTLKLIRAGVEDEDIKKEYQKQINYYANKMIEINKIGG